jgi:hypothetical protein
VLIAMNVAKLSRAALPKLRSQCRAPAADILFEQAGILAVLKWSSLNPIQ